MSESMIERVARVLCRFTWETQFGKQDLDACVDQEWPNHTDAARLSIEAMWAPTKAMVDAGYAFTADPCFREDFISAWNAAIDEALK